MVNQFISASFLGIFLISSSVAFAADFERSVSSHKSEGFALPFKAVEPDPSDGFPYVTPKECVETGHYRYMSVVLICEVLKFNIFGQQVGSYGFDEVQELEFEIWEDGCLSLDSWCNWHQTNGPWRNAAARANAQRGYENCYLSCEEF